MKRIIACLLLFSLWNTGLEARKPDDQRLKNWREILKNLPSDRDRVDSLVEWYYLDKPNPLPLDTLSQTALSIAVRSSYREGEGTALNMVGHVAFDKGDFITAEVFYRNSAVLRKSLGDNTGAASSYNNQGNALKEQGRFQEAADAYRAGTKLFSSEDDPQLMAILYNGLGIAQKYLGVLDTSLASFNTSLEIARTREDWLNWAKANINLVSLLQDDLGRVDKAGMILRDSLSFLANDTDSEEKARYFILYANYYYYRSNPDSALVYLDKAEALKDFLSPGDLAIIWKNRGRQFLEKKEYDKASAQFQKALDIFTKIGNHREATGTYFEFGNLHFEQAGFKPALDAYKNALEDSAHMDNPLLVSRILFMLGETYTALGQYPLASEYKSRYIALGDSIATRNEAAMVYQMQLGEKDSKLVLSNLQQTKAKVKTLKSYLFSGIGIAALLLGLAFSFNYINRQKRNLAEQEALFIRQEAIEQIQLKELEATHARLESEEATRTRIGKELHDGLGSMLSTVKLYYSSVEEKIGNLQEESKERYQKANLLLDQACEQVRSISHEMMSAFLLKFGLKAQLESFAETIRDSGQLEVELATHGLKDRLDSKLEFNIYRIVQELVNNVIKHAGASKISIQVNRFESMVNIMVEDNGKGFDPEEATNKEGVGLKNIRSRVHDLDGTTDFESAKGKGTSVSIDIPLQPGSPGQNRSSTSSPNPINN